MPTIKEKINGFLTLKDVVYWIAISAALIGPYLIHERCIATITTDIAVIKFQISEIKDMVKQHLEESKKMSYNTSSIDDYQ
jgi:hypothetical protein